MKLKISTKHLQIDKAQSTIVLVIALATVVTVFCLVSSKALLSQAAYQRKVLSETNQTKDKLEANIKAADSLVDNYNNVFIGNAPSNVIGGRNTDDAGAKPPDGTNSRIVLDALPTSYDFPALVTSVASILSNANMSSPNIAGTDQSTEVSSAPLADPQPVPINISVSGSSSYASVQQLVKDFERSIRPFDVMSITLSGGESQMQVNMNMNTYFQPAKDLSVVEKEVK